MPREFRPLLNEDRVMLDRDARAGAADVEVSGGGDDAVAAMTGFLLEFVLVGNAGYPESCS